MRIRKFTALAGCAITFFCCILLYRIADRSLFSVEKQLVQKSEQSAIRKSENERRNVDLVDRIHGGKLIGKSKKKEWFEPYVDTCPVLSNEVDADIQMLEVYKTLRFDNPDGGVWRQGWPITPNAARWTPRHPLHVIVVPHSHNDPGWLKTFDDYYISSTRNILNSMLAEMSSDSRKKFIWAEISFFSLWWDELSADDQRAVRSLVTGGQLEIVTGGWVMNDEANAHFYSILTQLTEGHVWVRDNLGVNPKNSWCIDPFGKSSTMPFLLKKMGLDNLVIQRVHYSIKKYLAQTKNLEFRWRQLWDNEGKTDFFTHMMPFYSYDVPHTCGPDPKVCCQFDFKRLPGRGLSCPWKEPPRPITSKNVHHRSLLLLDQYRKKAELFRTNVVLVPLGDDFRYEHPAEWDNQFDNYFQIFEYFNSHPELHVKARFGTLNDFFTTVMAETTKDEFPTLHGDFFTYADRDDHYWSGYYSSRPFHKRMDRVLMSYLRSAEILYALAWGSKPLDRSAWLLAPQSGLSRQLRDARRALALFQHHDGVAGTARDHVMEDYARRMLEAIGYAHHVLQQAAHYLLTPRETEYRPDAESIYFDIDDHRRNQNSLSERKLLIFRVGESKRIVFFNSLTRRRQEVVSVHVFKKEVSVTDGLGAEISCQISPVFLQGSVMDSSRYELSFIADLPPLGLGSYTVTLRSSESETKENSLAQVTIFNSFGALKPSPGFESVTATEAKEFTIDSTKLRAVFTEQGLLKSVTNKITSVAVPLHIEFFKYSARQGIERSGAYLFLPAGEAEPVRPMTPTIRIIRGPLLSRADVVLPNVRHIVTLYNSPGIDSHGIEIANLVDISKDRNYELSMRFKTRVRNLDEFYTDSNAFQMIKRKRFAKLPLQANFYPMPQSLYIEDDDLRVTLVSAQPLGAASLKEGQFEVIQDRRLQQDDNRGLGQGVLDNRPSLNLFRVLIEHRSSCKGLPNLLSIGGQETAMSLLNPLIPMIWHPESTCDLAMSWAPGDVGLSSDVELVTARTFDNDNGRNNVGLVFHRTNLDSCFVPEVSQIPENVAINLDKLLPDLYQDTVTRCSLSFMKQIDTFTKHEDINICPMDFLALLLER